ncbi:MAG TPA: peptide ABC transporter permease, partial [Pseudomonas sp.]|nr:peptide ABC transporter permease [Pseudomonas sp.]
MIGYLLRRLAYGVLILIGVNLLTFLLFFTVNTPDDMARLAIGGKYVTAEAIEDWKAEHGYDKPLLINTTRDGMEQLTDTLFFERSASLLVFDFGTSDSGRDIGREIAERAGPSLALALPTFVLGLAASVGFALLLVFFRATRL